MNLQEIFNLAWEHFVIKKNPPAASENTCYYAMPDGRKCAIGLAIPDGHAAQRSRGMLFSDLLREFPLLFDIDLDLLPYSDSCGDINPLDYFQSALHDDLITNEEWSKDINMEDEYRKVAKLFRLTVPASKNS